MNKTSEIKYRALNRDGSDNIDRSQIRRGWDDLYHRLLAVSWIGFFAATVIAYLSINLIFAISFFALGAQGIEGVLVKEGFGFFTECFFFSVQTFSTIGYGRLAPVGLVQNILASVEAFTGMLSIAVMSGLLFARFSRPKSKISFSDVALITPFMGHNCLVFRMANTRLNQIAEAKVSVVLMKVVDVPEGGTMRTQFDLNLHRDRSLFFAGSWLVYHKIDSTSPLYGMTDEELKNRDCEIFVSLMGHDETYAQTITARFSYLWDEIVWNRHFADMLSRKEGRLFIDVSKISKLKEI
jgi:inward rectifier potassium channel